ncbi:phosphate ABC transporter permease subunit PstC [Chlorogloea sp. CCALA 695]|uniref:phosphate ABC transporter permease subunit PstC n=1 Tax=Chlorogloea sp. CCALA 695 TaxID=2107693 RepID=UPI000D07F4A8|nr:phosphate ABC transporter permease subunit PstC [Chlorogloea sp. CCALA 695]PSB30721.1 phosphate ABC transporter permease subunit PstC [Chlorogloea sp. CCALA 695]
MSSLTPQAQTTIKPRASWEKNLDLGFVWLTRLLAMAIAAVLLWIALEVAIEAMPAIQRYGLGFLTSTAWNPVKEEYGALPQIYGTIVTAFIALLLAVPIGVGTALVVSENFLPVSVQTVVVFLIELLAAIPSVVYGLWGIFVLIPILTPIGRVLHSSLGWLPIFGTPPSGPGIFPAGIVLTIMILPIITAISRDALVSLPPDLRQAAYGLGATRWETIFRVLLPAATSGIVGATMLGLGRAMGETMAVTMIIGNSNRISPSILTTGNTIASLLANQFAEADGIQTAALMYAALVLFGLTLVVNVLAELVVRKVGRI